MRFAHRRPCLLASVRRTDGKAIYQFEDVTELREKQNKEISKLLDKGLKLYIKEFFAKHKGVYKISFDQEWNSNDEGGSNVWISVSLLDKDFEDIDQTLEDCDEIQEEIQEDINNLPNDLREEIGGEYFRSPKIKAAYEKRRGY